jgi:sialate O-acetylesterase
MNGTLRRVLPASALLLAFAGWGGAQAAAGAGPDGFVTVKGTHFVRKGQPWYVAGTNLWYGSYLGSASAVGRRERLLRELDRLKALGINNVRVLAVSEKTAMRSAVSPATTAAPGQYDEQLLQGLDFLLAELGKRDMTAVLYLNNFWQWSGGMTQYLNWFTGSPAHDPNASRDYERFMAENARFYTNGQAQAEYRRVIAHLIRRTNSVTGKPYRDDPAIMAWQLANEPRPGKGKATAAEKSAYVKWILETAHYIRSLDGRHMVSSGSEGLAGSAEDGRLYLDAHRTPDIAYLTYHLWPANWGWFDPKRPGQTWDRMLDKSLRYLNAHVDHAKTLGKPIVLEEFGLNRDNASFDTGAPTTVRDRFYGEVFGLLQKRAAAGDPVAGWNFWAWGGAGRAANADYWWRPGNDFVGDPPQEEQGLYSVFDSDTATLGVIRQAAQRLRALEGGADQPGLTLDSLFGDHMVLPRHGAVVSGRAAPRERISVSGFGGRWEASADGSGRFSVPLPDFAPGRSGSLTVSGAGGRALSLADLVTGDVYLCSGQSNMQLPVTRALNADVVTANAANPMLRMATVAVDPAPAPRERLANPAPWEAASPQTVPTWSAACYFFGQELQQKHKLPIGLVHASLGGSNITAWLSPEATLPDYARQQDLLKVYATDQGRASVAFGRQVEEWWQATGGPGKPWAATPAELAGWRAVPDVTKNWEKWNVPELAAYDGSVWYGAAVKLSAAHAAQAATLELGLIDEIDISWVNGKPVGLTSGAGTPRAYPLPAGALKTGDNTIVANIVDLWSFGGMYGDQPRRLRLADGSIVPVGAWRWQIAPPAQKYPPRAPWDAMSGVSVLYNGMIAPLGKFPFRGALWYQGETNVGTPYQALQTRLFGDWRRQFGDDMLFAVVQLANFGARTAQPAESALARLREDQRLAVLKDRNAVLVTAVDLGEPGDIHPANKQAVGQRLARAVARKLYGEAGSGGPMIRAAVAEGGRILLDFDGIEGALLAYGAGRPIGFETCDASGCRWAEAQIAGLQVFLPDDGKTQKVRYCWADAPTCTLYDGKSGLPAFPFEQPVKR